MMAWVALHIISHCIGMKGVVRNVLAVCFSCKPRKPSASSLALRAPSAPSSWAHGMRIQ
jgi:hypothetical protein